MTATEQQIVALLERRRAIVQTPEGGFTANHRWLLDAVELLLRHQLELVEELRNAGILPMSWWVVQCEAQREHMVRVLLMRAKYETYIPRIKHRSRISPLFPSYLFVRTTDRWYPVRWTDHVVRVLMSGDQPAQLPEAVITGIRKRETGGFVKLPQPPQLRKGQHVRVIRGSFEGLLAVHQGMGSRERVWVLLNLMNQQVAVELPSRDLEPLPVVC